MRKFITTIGIFAVGIFGFALHTQAAPYAGQQSKVENQCTVIGPTFQRLDCSYDGSGPNGLIFGFGPTHWGGPQNGGSYFAPGDAPPSCRDADAPDGTCPPHSGQSPLSISGDLTIDDNETDADPADDKISGTMVIAAGSRSWACRNGEECNEGWDSVTHTIPATTVSSAVANSAGGYDYVIASKGIPGLLMPCTRTTIPGVPEFPAFGSSFNCAESLGGDNLGGMNFANQVFPSVTATNPGGSAWQGIGEHLNAGGPSATVWTAPAFSDGPIIPNNGIATFEHGGACMVDFSGSGFAFTEIPMPPGFASYPGCNLFFGNELIMWVPDGNIGVATTVAAEDLIGYTCDDSGPLPPAPPAPPSDPPSVNICNDPTAKLGPRLSR